MSTASFLLAMVTIAVIFLISYVKEKVKRGKKEEKKAFPSGRDMRSDAEMLSLTLDELRKWRRDDLRWLINYVGHKIEGKENQDWEALFDKASQALYNY